MKKKLMSVLLVLAMALTLLPASALAATGTAKVTLCDVETEVETVQGTKKTVVTPGSYDTSFTKKGDSILYEAIVNGTLPKGYNNVNVASGEKPDQSAFNGTEGHYAGIFLPTLADDSYYILGRTASLAEKTAEDLTTLMGTPNASEVVTTEDGFEIVPKAIFTVPDGSVWWVNVDDYANKGKIATIATAEKDADNDTFVYTIYKADFSGVTYAEDVPVTLTFAPLNGQTPDFWGKKPADMGEDFAVTPGTGNTIKVTGTANYVDGYTGFNGSVVAEQSGHYLPIKITGGNEGDTIKTYNRSDGTKTGKTLTFGADESLEVVFWLDGKKADYPGTEAAALADKTFKVVSGTTAYTVDFSGVTLLPKPAAGQTVTSNPPAAGETVGTVEVSKGGNTVELPENLASGTGSSAVDLSKMEVKVEPVATNTDVTVDEATNTTVSGAIQDSNSKIVEVTIKELKSDGTTKDEKLFTGENAIPSGIKVVIGGLTGGETYHVFCIKDDGTVIYYGSKILGEGESSLDFTTGHLCHFAAVKETPELKEAVKTMPVDSSSNLTPSTIAVTGVTLDKITTSIEVGASDTLTATVEPSNATNKAVTWSSSDTAIATVSSSGVVTGVKAGTATITAATADGPNATCTVTVTAASSGGKTPSKSSSSGGGGGAAVSNVSIGSTSHGSVSVSPRNPSKNAKVTLTVRPNSGYVLDTVTVKDSKGAEVELTKVSDTEYTFTMPSTRVTVDAKFVSDGSAPAETAPQGFSDVPADYWAKDEIAWASTNNVMGGFADGSFRPANQVSRQQTWMVIARIAGASPADMAAAKAWAVSSGVSDGTRPGESLTRQQLVTILYRYAQMKGFATSGAGDLSSYPDAASVSSYAQEAMAWAVGSGIVSGTAEGLLNPAGTATRAQFAVIMYRFSQQTAG